MASGHTLFVCQIIIHRAEHVPIGDLNTLSCDPYILANLEVPGVHPDYPRPPLFYRTPTLRQTLNPVYNAQWIVGGLPEAGFTLTLDLIDEDPGDRDDCLGKAVVHLPEDPDSHQLLHDEWHTGELECKVEKRRGSIKSHVATYLATIMTRGYVSHHARIYMSVRVIGKVHNQGDRRVYTVGPPKYTRHFSPLIGHFISGAAANNPSVEGKHNKLLGSSTFIANRLQLLGPTPASLRHHYVGYAPFIKSLFKKIGIRGKLLNYALHRQFHTIYGYDKSTVYGIAGLGEIDTDCSWRKEKKGRESANEDAKSNRHTAEADESHQQYGEMILEAHTEALSREFLRMTSYGTAGRLFTYVITLDSEWRFTETGEEFSIDLLSKHSMHADLAKEIAFSGEFFVRTLSNHKWIEGSWGGQPEPLSDKPKDYELVIDNDSGTYRPKKELLPTLQNWLEHELGALGKVTAVDGFDETLKIWKIERENEKRRAKGLKPHSTRGGNAQRNETEKGRDKQLKPNHFETNRTAKEREWPDKLFGAFKKDAKRARENEEDKLAGEE